MMSQLFPHKLNRLQYLARFAIFLTSVSIIVIGFLVVAGNAVKNSFHDYPSGGGQSIIFFLLFAVLLIFLKIVMLDGPRLRSMGWNLAFLFLMLVPYLNSILQILLFVVPPLESPEEQPLKTGC